MAHTNQDDASIINRQKNEIDILTQKLNNVYSTDSARQRSLGHIIDALNEAIAMAKNIPELLDKTDPKYQRRRSEALRLQEYFRDALRDMETVLAGYQVYEPAQLKTGDEPQPEVAPSTEPHVELPPVIKELQERQETTNVVNFHKTL